MTYLSSLSRVQWVWFIGALTAVVMIVAAGWILGPVEPVISTSSFTTEMSIREIAPELEVTNKALARELGLPIDVPKRKPLKKFGITQDELDRAIVHLSSHRPSQLRYYICVALALWGLVFLCRLRRPDGLANSQRRIWYPRMPYLLAVLAAGVVFGFGLGKSPNPMEGIVKVLKSMVGLYPSVTDKVIALVFFLCLSRGGKQARVRLDLPFRCFTRVAL